MDNSQSRICQPRGRCGDFRACPICARIRQAKISDAAERLQSRHRSLTWTTITPDSRDWRDLIKSRDAFLRAEAPPGAIWTVERGHQAGRLHCNILHPASAPRSLRRAAVWQAPLEFDARVAAAYISKREQMPPKDDYGGRLYGTAGPLWQWLAGADAPAPVAAAKTQYDLDPAPLRLDSGVSRQIFVAGRDYTREDYREIAARRLPDLLRATPLHRARHVWRQTPPPSPSAPQPYAWRLKNSKRVRWIAGTLRPWEKDWKPKSCR